MKRKILRFILCGLVISSTVFGAQLPGVGKFTVGYNEAWFAGNYGTDLTSNFNPSYVSQVFDGMAKGGATIVRVFLFEALQGVTLGKSVPQTLGVEAGFMQNLNTLLGLARQRGLKVYVTLLEGNEIQKSSGPRKDYYWNLLNNKYGEGDVFRSRVIRPVLQLLNSNRDVIYALDLMNEIEAPISANFLKWSDAQSWIKDSTAFVKSYSSWLPVTSTAGWGYAVSEVGDGFFSGLGLDFYDVHVYTDSGTYSGVTNLCAKVSVDKIPIILGEYGQKSQVVDDSMQYSATANFLNTAKSQCFSAALAWRYDAAEQFWAYAKPDGRFRPAYYVIKAFGTPH